MKKKIIILIIIISILLISALSLFIYNKNIEKNNRLDKIKLENEKTNSLLNNKNIDIENIDIENIKLDNISDIENLEKNINTIKVDTKENTTKLLLKEWNDYLRNNEYLLALWKYIKAKKKDPNNINVIKSIAKTYFLMKDWEKTYTNYTNILAKNKLLIVDIYKELILSNIYKTFNKNDIKSFSWTIADIKNLEIDEELKFYYTNSISCIFSYSICEKNFSNYINKTNISYKTDEILSMKQAFINYNNFKYEEEYYKKTLIIWEFLKFKLYPIVIILWEELLKEKQSYLVIMKMLAQSYYEIWNLEKTSVYLKQYQEINTDDKDVLYLLWIISQKSHDYLLSNMFLKKSIEKWYEPKKNVYRIELYNSYMLKDDKRTLDLFKKLIESQKEPEYKDLVLASYFTTMNWYKEEAYDFIEIWLNLHKDKEDFFWFLAFLKMKENDLKSAEKNIKMWYYINKNNAFINMTYGLLKKEIWEDIKAMIYLQKALKLDTWWEISKISLEELEKIKENRINLVE